MALIPTIPTSFVPHASPAGKSNFHVDFARAFELIAYAVFIIAFLLAIGVFFYGRILVANVSAKDAELAKAESALDPATVTGFLRLNDRLNSSKTLIANHIAVSSLFSIIESVIPSNVRFLTLAVKVDATGGAKIDGSGVAKSFNTLAATSAAFANDGRIKDAIFSKITVNKDSSVSFGFSGVVGPDVIAFSPSMTPLGASPTPTPTPTPTQTLPKP